MLREAWDRVRLLAMKLALRFSAERRFREVVYELQKKEEFARANWRKRNEGRKAGKA